MLADKLTVLAALAALSLTGCPGEDEEGEDTNAVTMTMTTASTNDTEDEETESAATTDEPASSSGMMSTSSTTAPESTSGSECTEADECITEADCPNPTTDSCIGCLCVSGEETGSGMCTPGMCSGCGECLDCQMCAQSMGGECETEVATCNMNPACQMTIMCANMCMDAACQMQCVEDNPDGEADFIALISCLLAPGSGVCDGPC